MNKIYYDIKAKKFFAIMSNGDPYPVSKRQVENMIDSGINALFIEMKGVD